MNAWRRPSWLERVGLLILLAAAVYVLWLGGALSPTQQVLFWGAWLVALAVLLRRGWLRLFGPVLFYDLVRIARRRRYFLLRVLYAGLLLLLLSWVFLVGVVNAGPDGIRANEMARFAEHFFDTFMSVQFVIVALLTPAYTAGAIAEEKDRQTLEFLLATDLDDREIVLSKLVARLANIALIVLTGLPILGILQVLGGIDPNLVLAGFAATGLTLASLGGLSILNSVLTKKPRDAIAATYLGATAYLALSGMSWLLLIPGLGVANFPSTASWSSPVTVADLVGWFSAGNIVAAVIRLSIGAAGSARLDDLLAELLRDYAVFHGLVAVATTTWAVLRLRPVALRQSHGPERKESARNRRWRRPRVGSRPMLWKELCAEPGFRFNWLGKVVIVLLVVGSFVPVVFIITAFLDRYVGSGPTTTWGPWGNPWAMLGQSMNIWERFIGTVVACLMLLSVAVRASSTVSGERDRQTLDALLTSPLRSGEILWAKWLGSILSVRWAWLWLGLVWLLAVVCGGLHFLCPPLLLLAWFAYAGALASLGLWFSVASRTTLRATLWTLLATAGLGVGHWALWMCCVPVLRASAGPPDPAFEWAAKVQAGLTPPLALAWLLPFRPDYLTMSWEHKEEWELACGLIGLPFWCIIAFCFYTLTLGRFQQIVGRVPRRPPKSAPGERQPVSDAPTER